MDFNEKINVTGRLEVIQINNKTGEETVLFDDHNVITGGLGQSIAHMMATRGCTLEPCLPESVRFGPRTSDSSVGTTNSLNETRTGGVNPPASTGGQQQEACYIIGKGTLSMEANPWYSYKTKLEMEFHCECTDDPGAVVGAPGEYGGGGNQFDPNGGTGGLKGTGGYKMGADSNSFSIKVFYIRWKDICTYGRNDYGSRRCTGAGLMLEEKESSGRAAERTLREWRAAWVDAVSWEQRNPALAEQLKENLLDKMVAKGMAELMPNGSKAELGTRDCDGSKLGG